MEALPMSASPHASVSDRVDNQPIAPRPSDIDEEAKKSLSILVIDDERTLRESCRLFLETEGYAVEVCSKGDEAQNLLRRRTYDIVLIDQYMSDVPGAKLLETCLEKSPNTIVLIMTGNPSQMPPGSPGFLATHEAKPQT